jgi:hypothetical protein
MTAEAIFSTPFNTTGRNLALVRYRENEVMAVVSERGRGCRGRERD